MFEATPIRAVGQPRMHKISEKPRRQLAQSDPLSL
jgi:hypothetical protein